jgi:hypothetical protein
VGGIVGDEIAYYSPSLILPYGEEIPGTGKRQSHATTHFEGEEI